MDIEYPELDTLNDLGNISGLEDTADRTWTGKHGKTRKHAPDTVSRDDDQHLQLIPMYKTMPVKMM